MVSRLVLVWLALAAGLANAGTLELQLRSTEGEWGKPLRGYLVYRGEDRQLLPDYAPWRPWVVVDPDYQEYDEDADGHPVIRQALRLYPRRSGRWQLPSLRAGGADSEPVWVDIAPPRVEGHALQVRHAYPEGGSWTRQARRLTLTLLTDDPQARVVALPAADSEQALFTPLPSRRTVIRDGQGEHYAFRFDWWLQATAAGQLRIEPPVLHYRRHGRDRRRFYLPLIELGVQAVPEYIPPTTPVARPTIDSRITRDADGAYWHVRVSAPAPLATGLPLLERQLAGLGGRPDASLVPVREQVSVAGKAQTILSYRVPLPDWLLPGITPATVQLRYFDPQAAQLEVIRHRMAVGWHWPDWAGVVAAILLLLPGYVLARVLWRGMRVLWLRLMLRRAIRDSDDPGQLRRYLLAAAGVATLGEWAALPGWGRHRAAAVRLAQSLNAVCFGPDQAAAGEGIKRRARALAWHVPIE